MTTLKNPLLGILETLEQERITVVLLRDEPQQIPTIDELDILVSPQEQDRVHQVCIAAGWSVYDTGLFHPCKRAYVALSSSRLLKLDVHFAAIDGPLIYDSAQEYLRQAERCDGFLVLSTSDWCRHVVMHTVLGKERLQDKHAPRLQARLEDLRRTHPEQLERIARLLGIDACELTTDRLRQADEVRRLRRRLTRSLLVRNGNAARSLWWRAIWLVGPVLMWRRGVTIAFMGPDGAGKSTTINNLSARLQTMGITTRIKYLGPWEHHVFPTSKLLNALRITPHDHLLEEADKTGRPTKKLKARLKLIAYYLNLPIEMWWRHLYLVLPHLVLRRVVLADRCVHDLQIGHHNTAVQRFGGVRRFIVRTSPAPDILVFLDNDAKTIWERKQEYPIDLIASSLERYRAVARSTNALVVRTDRPENVVCEDLVSRLLPAILRAREDRIRLPWRSVAIDNLPH